ncbi:MAG TPA: queuosine precursor transporter [Gammaproteobacteria bacterium]|nr:queuosine precursor transporter [Gammaproteobacteria bacterium]
MRDNLSHPHLIRLKPHFLWFLTLTYAMVIVLANWFDPRLIKIAGLTTDAGTLIFPLTFLLSDLITEVYGYKHARRAIWCGFLFNALFIIYGQLVIHLPSPDYPTNNAMFDTLLTTNIRIILASGISYLISEPLNSYIMAKLKIKMHGRHIGVRFLASTLFASGLDSFIFSTIAFYGVMNNINLWYLILTMWLIKVLIETLGLPVSIRLAKKLKQAEKLDIYDKNTDFNLFRLDAEYSEKDNKY